MKIAIAVLMASLGWGQEGKPIQLETVQYVIEIGTNTISNADYSVVIGDGVVIEGGAECQIKIGHLGDETKRMVRAAIAPNQRFQSETGRAIDKHCGYKQGTVDNLIQFATWTSLPKPKTITVQWYMDRTEKPSCPLGYAPEATDRIYIGYGHFEVTCRKARIP